MRTWPKFLPVLLLTGALAAPAAPAAATDPDPCRDEDGTLLLTEHQAWIKDPEGIKVGNAAALGATSFPSWDDEPPTGSLADGAGGGWWSSGLGAFQQVPGDWHDETSVTLHGSFDGCLDNLAVTVYFNHTAYAVTKVHTMAVRLFVEDNQIADSLVYATVFQNALAPGSPPASGARFAFAGLVDALAGAGLDPSAGHEITLQWQPRSDLVTTAYLWDATEVPTNLLFNAGSLDGFRIVE